MINRATTSSGSTLRDAGSLPFGISDGTFANTSSGSKRSSKKPEIDIAEADESLWQALRAARMAIAKEQGVPPYVIFHDATLLEILRSKPQSTGALSSVSGVGATKLERYGAAFIKVLTEHTD